MKCGVSHNDANDWNIIVNEEGNFFAFPFKSLYSNVWTNKTKLENAVVALIDYGDACFTAYVCNLAICMAYCMLLNKKRCLEVAKQVFLGTILSFLTTLTLFLIFIENVWNIWDIVLKKSSHVEKWFRLSKSLSIVKSRDWDVAKSDQVEIGNFSHSFIQKNVRKTKWSIRYWTFPFSHTLFSRECCFIW